MVESPAAAGCNTAPQVVHLDSSGATVTPNAVQRTGQLSGDAIDVSKQLRPRLSERLEASLDTLPPKNVRIFA